MKYILTILFLCWTNCYATIYYVSNTGDDGQTGTSALQAWQTIAKVNSSPFLPGDQILFKCGDSWNEQLKITSSGTQASPIIIGSYGTGDKPLITGFQSLSGFTNVGNIWTAVATNSVLNLNLILINGNTAYKARYPNTGYLTFTSYGADSSYITGSLTGTPSYAGKECVIRTVPWVLDKREVATQVGGKLTFTKPLTYIPQYGGNGYFFQNDSTFIDTLNEWSFKNSTKKLDIYANAEPVVQIATIDTLVFLSKNNFITFDGLSFTGANKNIFQIDTARGITIKNCSLNYSGAFGILALKSNLLTVNSDSIQNCYSNGIYGRQLDYYTTPVNQCDSAVVTNSTIKNIGIYAGMGESGNARYNAIYIQGVNLGPQIIGNRVDSVGYIGIDFHGKYSLIKNNIVSNFCFVKNDGGGIYTVSNTSYLPLGVSDSSKIISNIVHDGIDAQAGTSQGHQAYGIYTDNMVRYMDIDSNTIYNCAMSGVLFHESTNINFRNNNLFNNNSGIYFLGMSETSSNNMYVTKNSFYSSANSPNGTYADLLINANGQHTIFASTYLGTMDSNYYCRPYNESNSFNINSTSYWSLSQWQTGTGLDAHSTITPTGVNKWPVQYLVNTLSVPQTFRILGTYIAPNGTSYTNFVTLEPYQSVTLIKATVNDGTAFPPAYLNIGTSKIIQQ